MKTMEKSEFEKLNAFGTGRDNTAYARYFIGRSYLNPLTKPQDGLAMSNVTFEPGCRNNWHIHHATAGGGQILICTAGEGWYQEEGKAPVSLKPGMVVAIPANVKHWHGAKADSWFSHIAFEIPGENGSTEWCEPVTDEVYNALYKENAKRRANRPAVFCYAFFMSLPRRQSPAKPAISASAQPMGMASQIPVTPMTPDST